LTAPVGASAGAATTDRTDHTHERRGVVNPRFGAIGEIRGRRFLPEKLLRFSIMREIHSWSVPV
jgi:hypothetical protein